MLKGGKALTLEILVRKGFAVPPFFVCDKSWSEKNIQKTMQKMFPTVDYFAVRSSAQNEDSKEKSFAGFFRTDLGIPKKDVFKKVSQVIESFGAIPGSVIIQEFIPSDIAGVLFTEINKDTIIINSTIGLCQPVVQGESCDEYLCKKNGTLISQIIPKEKTIQLFIQNKIITRKEKKASLGKKELGQLVQLAHQIQNFLGSPQDIEWCFKNEKLYILQSRPITKDFSIGKEEYFDSANIAESYSGIVLPLTCSFAKMVYENTYKDLLHMSGVSRSKLDRHSPIFENLLGFFYGRMYYNMNNWYHMAEFVPGYRRNKKNFELMITSNVKKDVETSIKPSLLLSIFYPIIVIIKILTFGIASARFKSNTEKQLQTLQNHDMSILTYTECIHLFKNLDKNLLHKWYVTVENDFLVMTYLGILSKLIDNDQLQEAIVFPSKATEQVSALTSLSKIIQKNTPLWQTLESGNLQSFHTELTHDAQAKKALAVYLRSFGGRFANELKLESVGLEEDPEKLFSVLKAYSHYQPKSVTSNFELHASSLKELITKIILHKFKKYASRREEFRLLRSNAFSMVRRLFRQMGSLLAQSGTIAYPDDIFYLELHEILQFHPETNTELLKKIEGRKKKYLSFEKISPPSHFSTTDGRLPTIEARTQSSSAQTIQARPASPGKIKGKIRVFKEFSIPATIDFDILVASHTDPGWTSLIALSKGLIIEHGGVLSHASIVARELGIPAIIGAENATETLTNSQIVEIDGSSGTLKIF